MIFIYSVIRYLPDPVAGEQINLGIIVGSGGSWETRLLAPLDLKHKMEEFSKLVSGSTKNSFIEEVVENILPNLKEKIPNQDALFILIKDNANNIQFTYPLHIIADSITEALDILWPEFFFKNTSI